MTLEVGKPLVEAKGEINGAADIFEWNAEETKRIYGQTIESRSKIQEFMFIINLLVLLPHYHLGTSLQSCLQEKFQPL